MTFIRAAIYFIENDITQKNGACIMAGIKSRLPKTGIMHLSLFLFLALIFFLLSSSGCKLQKTGKAYTFEDMGAVEPTISTLIDALAKDPSGHYLVWNTGITSEEQVASINAAGKFVAATQGQIQGIMASEAVAMPDKYTHLIIIGTADALSKDTDFKTLVSKGFSTIEPWPYSKAVIKLVYTPGVQSEISSVYVFIIGKSSQDTVNALNLIGNAASDQTLRKALDYKEVVISGTTAQDIKPVQQAGMLGIATVTTTTSAATSTQTTQTQQTSQKQAAIAQSTPTSPAIAQSTPTSPAISGGGGGGGITWIYSSPTKTTAKTATTAKTTETICVPNWQCSAWGNCIDSKKIRTCTDTNNCEIQKDKPAEETSCYTAPAATPTSTAALTPIITSTQAPVSQQVQQAIVSEEAEEEYQAKESQEAPLSEQEAVDIVSQQQLPADTEPSSVKPEKTKSIEKPASFIQKITPNKWVVTVLLIVGIIIAVSIAATAIYKHKPSSKPPAAIASTPSEQTAIITPIKPEEQKSTLPEEYTKPKETTDTAATVITKIPMNNEKELKTPQKQEKKIQQKVDEKTPQKPEEYPADTEADLDDNADLPGEIIQGYIQNALNTGFSTDEIKADLLKAGWDRAQVEKKLGQIINKSKTSA